MKHITVYDIAKEANVSVSTVSRVLNNTAPVRASTRERITQIINKYQFQPNALARSLTKKETGMIGVILPDITNPFFPEVFTGAENEARKHGFTFFLCNTAGDYGRESEYLHVLREKRVDGIIFMGGRINLARCKPELVREVVELSNKLPIVLVNGNLPRSGLIRVITDEAAGAKMAVRHLFELGHREIGFIGGVDDMATTIDKAKAFKSTLEEHGLHCRKEWMLHGNFSVACGRELMTRLLELQQCPTAVLCVNDFTAIGAMKSAVEHGMSIPDDISIVGFDDTPLASTVIPELTTISQQTHELGRRAVQVLHQMMKQEKAKKLTAIQPQLVVRQSTGPVKADNRRYGNGF